MLLPKAALILVKTTLVRFRDQKLSPMDFKDNGPDYAAVARCNPLVVHLLNNLWCILIKTVDYNRDPGA